MNSLSLKEKQRLLWHKGKYAAVHIYIDIDLHAYVQEYEWRNVIDDGREAQEARHHQQRSNHAGHDRLATQNKKKRQMVRKSVQTERSKTRAREREGRQTAATRLGLRGLLEKEETKNDEPKPIVLLCIVYVKRSRMQRNWPCRRLPHCTAKQNLK